MAPRTSKRLQERAWDDPTKGLLWSPPGLAHTLALLLLLLFLLFLLFLLLLYYSQA